MQFLHVLGREKLSLGNLLCELSSRHGLPEEISLEYLTTGLSQEIALRFRFNTFGENFHVQIQTKGDDRI